MAKRTANGLNEIRKLINVEMKPIDTIAQVTATNSGSITYLSGVTQGDDYVHREGNSIRIVKFELLGTVFRDSSAGATQNDSVRILVIRDLQNGGGTPTVSEILEYTGTATSPYSPMKMLAGVHYSNRFTVVYDELLILDNAHCDRLVRFETSHSCHVMYRGTGSTTASAAAGAYFLVALSNASSTQPTFDFVSRITYTDN